MMPSPPASRRRTIGFFYIIPTGLFIGFLVFSGVQVFKNLTGSPLSVSVTPTPKTTRTNSTQISVTPSPTDEPIKENDVPILVLNGSGERGVAAALQEELEEEGFTNVRTGNAGKYTYTDLTVRVTETDKDAAVALREVLEKKTYCS